MGGLTLLSRILGYVRELLIASVIGAGPVSDAFFVALKLPSLFRRLFAEGAFNAAFVPIFSRVYYKESVEKAEIFVANALSYLMLALVGLIIFFEVMMPAIMKIIAPGFQDDPDKFQLVIFFARITFPYIFFISLAALLSGILNTLNHFSATTAAPILLNANAILALVLFASTPTISATALTWSVPVSGMFQLLWVWMACRFIGFPIHCGRLDLTHETRELFKRMLPGLLGGGVYQVNLLVSDIVASFIPSGISYLAFADRINQFPLSIIGVAMGTVLLPLLSRQFQEDQITQGLRSQNRAIQIALFLSLPAATALFIIAHPIIEVLYQHGRFTAEDTVKTSAALAAFVIGLPAYVMIKILSANFFARGDTVTPVKIAIFSIGLNLILTLMLVPHWSYVGIAIATALSSWVMMIVLGIMLYKTKYLVLDGEVVQSIPKFICACIIMGSALFYAGEWLLHMPTTYKEIALVGVIALGLGIYAAIIYSIRAINFQELYNAFGKI